MTRKGLDLVGNIKDGNFNDHSTYFGSLKLVNDAIANDSKVDRIVAYEEAIINDFRGLNDECRNSPNLSQEEIKYIASVYSNLLIESEKSLATLNAIIVNEASQMTDDERIERITIIYENAKDKYAFTRSFCNSTRMLIMQRIAERNAIDAQRKLNPAL